MTLGEYRVGIDFNPSGNTEVNLIKEASAALIDLINELDIVVPSDEVRRLQATAMTHVETAAMYAVKASTKKPMPILDKVTP